MEETIARLALLALPVLLAITLHEAAHGYVARMFGDRTAEQMGRISLNPARHIDPVGTILVPAAIFLLSSAAGTSGFLFGWAKPVPVNFARLRNPKADMLWVAAAGPGANLLMVVMWALFYKLALAIPASEFSVPLRIMSDAGIMVNLSLAVLNLLPLPPLDGGRILVSVLPMRAALAVSRVEPYGMWILLLLLFTGLLGQVIVPVILLARYVVALIFGF